MGCSWSRSPQPQSGSRRRFRHLPFVWPHTAGGDDCVFILERRDLEQRERERIAAAPPRPRAVEQPPCLVGAELLELAALRPRRQADHAVAHPHQAAYRQHERFEQTAHDPIAAFVHHDVTPLVRAFAAARLYAHAARKAVLQLDALREALQVFRLQMRHYPHRVFALDSKRGCIRRLASSPEVVKSSSPQVLKSSLPTETIWRRHRRQTLENARPAARSSRVVISPSAVIEQQRAAAAKTMGAHDTAVDLDAIVLADARTELA